MLWIIFYFWYNRLSGFCNSNNNQAGLLSMLFARYTIFSCFSRKKLAVGILYWLMDIEMFYFVYSYGSYLNVFK
jgi:hypothetical protein